jgi:hypothetical protein
MAAQISALPTVPTRQDPANFNTRADAFLAALPTFRTEANTLATEAEADAATAEAQAGIATAQAAAATAQATAAAANATAAAASAGAVLWVSGTTYAAGVVVYSPLTQLTYRRISGGAGTTDPSADPANWALAFSPGVFLFLAALYR